MLNRPHGVTVDVGLPAVAEGVLVCRGADAGGWTLFIASARTALPTAPSWRVERRVGGLAADLVG